MLDDAKIPNLSTIEIKCLALLKDFAKIFAPCFMEVVHFVETPKYAWDEFQINRALASAVVAAAGVCRTNRFAERNYGLHPIEFPATEFTDTDFLCFVNGVARIQEHTGR